ncbi:MAG: restriction endonuclease subunit S [Candidatus Wallbacteria bacterium]
MNKNWSKKKLNEICEVFADGDWIESKDQSSEGIRLIQTGNVGTGYFKDRAEKARYISETTFNKLKCTEIFEGDCLISRLPDPVGRTCILPNTGERMITAVDCTIVRFNTKILISEYFNYYSQSIQYLNDIEKETSGTTRKRVSRNKLGEIFIPLPPLSEQRRIVAILDEAFAAIEKAKENAEKNLKNAREIFESYLQNIFDNAGEGWEIKKLGEVCIVERGSSPRPIEKYLTNDSDGVNWIKIGDTKGIDKYIYTTKEKITKKGAEKSRYVKEGDFILSNSMSFGKPYIMKTEGYIHDGWFVLRLPQNIDTEFFWYLLASPFTMNQFISLASGAIVKNISGDLVKKASLPIPPLSEQHSIVSKLDDLSEETKKLESIYSQKLAALTELKKSLLQKAFAGEL